MSRNFTCDGCGESFGAAWTEEERDAEANSAFSPEELEDAAVVCDDCWRMMRAVIPDLDARYSQ